MVQFPPAGPDGYATILLTLSDKETNPLKQGMTLRCDFVGSPPQRITWYLDDTRIPLDSEVINLSDYQFKELTVNLAKAFKDNGNPQDGVQFGGEYKAIATSPYGQAECRTFVEIDTKLMIREFRQTKKPIEGKDYELKCYVLGRNSVNGVTIEWTKAYLDKYGFKKNHSLPLNHRHALKERGRTLVIKNMKKEEDDGNYTCTAKDKEGHRISKTIILDIQREYSVGKGQSQGNLSPLSIGRDVIVLEDSDGLLKKKQLRSRRTKDKKAKNRGTKDRINLRAKQRVRL